MSGIKQIFLDLDGPLLDGKERHYFCYRNILKKYGFKPINIDDYWNNKRSMMSRRDLLRLSGAENIYDDFFAEWLSMIESSEALAMDQVQEGVVNWLCICKEKGIELILVTMRKNQQALEEQLNSTNLRQFLDNVLVCDHAEGGKGKADAVRNLYQGNINRHKALWIGDTEADWEAANSLGINVVLVTNGLRDQEYLSTLEGASVVTSINLDLAE